MKNKLKKYLGIDVLENRNIELEKQVKELETMITFIFERDKKIIRKQKKIQRKKITNMVK